MARELVAEGFHRGRAIANSAQFGQSPDKGTDFVRVSFTITDGQFKNRVVVWDGWFTDASQQRTVESLQHCGCTFPDGDITNLVGIDTNEVSLDVEHEVYENDQGEESTFARVAWVNSLARGIKPELQMDDTKKASFRDRMRGVVAFATQGTKPAATGSGGTQGGAQPGGKLPF